MYPYFHTRLSTKTKHHVSIAYGDIMLPDSSLQWAMNKVNNEIRLQSVESPLHFEISRNLLPNFKFLPCRCSPLASLAHPDAHPHPHRHVDPGQMRQRAGLHDSTRRSIMDEGKVCALLYVATCQSITCPTLCSPYGILLKPRRGPRRGRCGAEQRSMSTVYLGSAPRNGPPVRHSLCVPLGITHCCSGYKLTPLVHLHPFLVTMPHLTKTYSEYYENVCRRGRPLGRYRGPRFAAPCTELTPLLPPLLPRPLLVHASAKRSSPTTSPHHHNSFLHLLPLQVPCYRIAQPKSNPPC